MKLLAASLAALAIPFTMQCEGGPPPPDGRKALVSQSYWSTSAHPDYAEGYAYGSEDGWVEIDVYCVSSGTDTTPILVEGTPRFHSGGDATNVRTYCTSGNPFLWNPPIGIMGPYSWD